MGLRQPSKTGAFFAQAAAGAQQQEEARKKLKQPQALGGAASAGTGMVAAQTEAQKGVTEQVKEQTGQAASTMVAAPIKSATAEAIVPSGTATAIPGATPLGAGSDDFVMPTTTSTNRTAKADELQKKLNTEIKNLKRIDNMSFGRFDYMGKANQQIQRAQIKGLINSLQEDLAKENAGNIMDLANLGDVDAVEARGKELQGNITFLTGELERLDEQLKTANAQDAKRINDEKTRLTTLLQSYQDKLTKENLGQMATTSTLEEELLKREKLLAQEGNEVGKLASLFGRNWDSKKRGGLESQIYGKDLEAIQEAAGAGLTAKERATRQGEAALTGYTEQLDRSKKAFTEALDKDSKKLEILKMDPKDLVAYTRKELTDLFGADQVKKLFKFDSEDPNATVTGTTSSSTRQALQDRLTKTTEEHGKLGEAKNVALQKATEQMSQQYFPKDQYGNEIGNSNINNLSSKINEVKSTPHMEAFAQEFTNNLAGLENQLRNAIKNGNKKEASRLNSEIFKLNQNWDNRVNEAKANATSMSKQDQENRAKSRQSAVQRVGTAIVTGGVSELDNVANALGDWWRGR